jgi:hypothetical protein
MLSNEGMENLKLLKQLAYRTWGTNLQIMAEKVINIPVDAFEIQMKIYCCYDILLEYETGTFALKIWDESKFVYLDKLTDEKVIYGFDSMITDSIMNNFNILDRVLKSNM